MNEDRINSVPIQLARILNGSEYKILDYLLYRSNLDGWNFWLSNISEETGTSIGTVVNVLRHFSRHGWICQDTSHHYSFDYKKWHAWFNTKVQNLKVSTEVQNLKVSTESSKFETESSKFESTSNSTSNSTSSNTSNKVQCTMINDQINNTGSDLDKEVDEFYKKCKTLSTAEGVTQVVPFLNSINAQLKYPERFSSWLRKQGVNFDALPFLTQRSFYDEFQRLERDISMSASATVKPASNSATIINFAL